MCKTLQPMANASQKELNALKAWRDDIRQEVTDWVDHIKTASDVGAKLSAALFNKETENICQKMAKAPKLAPVCTILLNSCLSSQTTPGSPRPWRPQTSTGLLLPSPPSTEVEVSGPQPSFPCLLS
jgi:hypothetical protein